MARINNTRAQSPFSFRHRLLPTLVALLILPILATRCSSDGNAAARSRSSTMAATHSMSNRDWLRLLSQLNASTDDAEKPVVVSSAARTPSQVETQSSSRNSGSATVRSQPLGRRIRRETKPLAADTVTVAIRSSRQPSRQDSRSPVGSIYSLTSGTGRGTSSNHLLDITSPLIGSYHSSWGASYHPRRFLGPESLLRPGTVLAGNRRNPGQSFWRRGAGGSGSLLGSLFRRRRKHSTLQFPRLDAVPPLSAVNSSYTRWSSVEAKEGVEGRDATFMTPVIDQQACDSCWVVVATDAVATLWSAAGAHGNPSLPPSSNPHPPASLSAQQACDCGTGHCCQGGWPETALQFVLYNLGVAADSVYPYVAADANQCNVGAAMQSTAQITGWERLPASDPASAMRALSGGVPAIIVYVSSSSVAFKTYFGGIFRGPCDGKLDHAMLLVGYSLTKRHRTPYWILKNSWGERWGEKGYMRMAMSKAESGRCGIFSIPPIYPVYYPSPNQPTYLLSNQETFQYNQTLSSPTCSDLYPPPCGGGTCSIVAGAPRCTCPPGFVERQDLPAPKCVPAIPCSTNPNPCGLGVCTDNFDGSYSCGCTNGARVGSRSDGASVCSDRLRSDAAATYTTLDGDTCDSIAQQFSITVSDLAYLNSFLNCNKKKGLAGGLVLAISGVFTNSTIQCVKTDVVQKRDTCATFAQRNNISTSQLQDLNPGLSCYRIPYQDESCTPSNDHGKGNSKCKSSASSFKFQRRDWGYGRRDLEYTSAGSANPSGSHVSRHLYHSSRSMSSSDRDEDEDDSKQTQSVSSANSDTGDDDYNGKKLKQSTPLCVAVQIVNTTKTITGSGGSADGDGGSLNETLSLAQCGQVYTALQGDTCDAVTAAFRLNQTELALLNPGLNCTRNITAGVTLCVAPLTTQLSTVTCYDWYSIKQGDTCALIWATVGMNQKSFFAINPGLQCAPQYLKIGQQVCINGTNSALRNLSSDSTLVYYSVQPEDTLSSIALSFQPVCGDGTTVNAICQANVLPDCTPDSPSVLGVDRLIYIPCSVTGVNGTDCGCTSAQTMCGADGVTYPSMCHAICNFALPATYGKCQPCNSGICYRRVFRAPAANQCNAPPSVCPFPTWPPPPYALVVSKMSACKYMAKSCNKLCGSSASGAGYIGDKWKAFYNKCFPACAKKPRVPCT